MVQVPEFKYLPYGVFLPAIPLSLILFYKIISSFGFEKLETLSISLFLLWLLFNWVIGLFIDGVRHFFEGFKWPAKTGVEFRLYEFFGNFVLGGSIAFVLLLFESVNIILVYMLGVFIVISLVLAYCLYKKIKWD